MYQYRIFNRTGLILRRILFVGAWIVIALVGLEVFEVLNILWEIDPLLMAAALAAILFGLALFLLRRRFRRLRFFLNAKGYRAGGNSSHREMKRYGRFLVNFCQRLGSHRLLTDQQALMVGQKTHDISEALHHHPLNDDLQRAIVQAREEVIGPTFRYLDEVAIKVTESKARAVIQDLYQPPFPVIAPLVVFYHQFTLVSEITDTYIAHPSLREYAMVMRDVWQVMTKGDFLRYGQRLFSGINSNPYSLGRAGEDLGQAFSVTWLTHAVARVATLRCCTLHDWDTRDAIHDMKTQIAPCLAATRGTLFKDALPILKERIRHYTPVSYDPAVFVEEIASSFVKSVDAVVLALSARAQEDGPQKTSPGYINSSGLSPLATVSGQAETHPHLEPGDIPRRSRHRRRRRHRHSGSRLSRMIEKIVYMGRPPRH